MSSALEDHPNTFIHPPLVMLFAIFIGFVARAFWGGFMDIVPRLLGEGLGVVLILSAIVILQFGLNTFAEGGEQLRPSTPSRQLFTKGIYAYSRNPIYCAMMLLGAGLGFATLNLWIILMTFLAGISINYLVIVPEERYLEDRFGEEYEAYKEKVRRWM